MTLLLRRPLTLGLGMTAVLSTSSLLRVQWQRPLLCEAASKQVSGALRTYETDAKVPVVKNGRLNPGAYSQISKGSILGLLGGVAVSTFSKPLALLIGLLVLGTQWLATKGIHILPTNRVQNYVTSIDLRSALEDNVAFKLSFGTTFLLAAFAKF